MEDLKEVFDKHSDSILKAVHDRDMLDSEMSEPMLTFDQFAAAVAELTPPLPASVEEAAERYSRNATVGQGEKARQSAKMDFIEGVKFRDRNVPSDEEIEEYVYSKNRANDITFNQAINHHIRKAAYWMRDRIVNGKTEGE